MNRLPTPELERDATAACRAVLVTFLAAIDHGHATTAVNLFTADALFTARGQQLHGRDAISQFLTTREAETDRHTIHVIANETIRGSDANETITLEAVLILLLRSEAGNYGIDRVFDTTQDFVRTPTGWKIASRDVTSFDQSIDATN